MKVLYTKPALITFLFLFCSMGCEHIGVKPWERHLLSKPNMQLNKDGLESGFHDHTYFSKEASSGGRGFAGGGCGCN